MLHRQLMPVTAATLIKQLVAGDSVKVNRLSESLRKLAQISSLQGLVVAVIVKEWIEQQEAFDRDGHYLLGLAQELFTEFGLAANPASRELLGGLKGSSKAAKAAKLILGLEEQPTVNRRAAITELIENRLARCQEELA